MLKNFRNKSGGQTWRDSWGIDDVSLGIGKGMAAQFMVSYFLPSHLAMSLSLFSSAPFWRIIILIK